MKNEALGLWYDSKTKVASIMSDLKSAIQQKRQQIEGNLVSSKINSSRGGASGISGADILDVRSTSHAQGFLKSTDEMIRKEIANMRKRQE